MTYAQTTQVAFFGPGKAFLYLDKYQWLAAQLALKTGRLFPVVYADQEDFRIPGRVSIGFLPVTHRPLPTRPTVRHPVQLLVLKGVTVDQIAATRQGFLAEVSFNGKMTQQAPGQGFAGGYLRG